MVMMILKYVCVLGIYNNIVLSCGRNVIMKCKLVFDIYFRYSNRFKVLQLLLFQQHFQYRNSRIENCYTSRKLIPIELHNVKNICTVRKL